MSKKSKKYISIGFIAICVCLLYYNILSNKSYEVLLNGNSIGIVKNKKTYTKLEKKINEGIDRRFTNKNGKDTIVLKMNLKRRGLSCEESIINNFFKNTNMTVETYGVFCKEEYLGSLDNEKEYNLAKEEVKNKYKEILKLKSINDFKIDNVKLKKCRVPLSKICIDKKASREKIAKAILNKHKLINVEFTSVVEERKEIMPSTVMKASDQMLKGKREIKQQGEKGLKDVYSKVTVKNEKIVNRQFIGEKVIKSSKDKIIVVGSKNPAVLGATCFSKPSRGSISSGFGMRWGRMHNGIDIASAIGSPIYAAYAGTITFSGWQDGYGKIVIIDHGNGLETRYAHCNELLVKVGDKVEENNIIAKVGNTGRSTGPHLHFEVRKNGTPINPIEYLK
ncbi:M23 family metallopeptidase [Haloimpatiens lingqiaonensis]|uniref:M23 family metallopeptidase n=1 Tax=Haloimpatiens lingqiaonensis TaxID=1380675 RepID=UPI0010FE2BF2|nr:peptidoglycan DD-metalloendopeptidase family protein [Haloimpatiens lingqiaonensis]